MSVNRRTLLGGGIGLGLAAGLGATAAGLRPSDAASASSALRIGYLPITDAAPLLVAHQRGLYEDFDVPVAEPVRFRSWAELAQAFVAGRVDVVHLLAPFAVQLRYGMGAPVRLIAWNHTNGSAITLSDTMSGLSDLAGQTFAIPYWWSIHNILSQDLFRESGLRPVVRKTPSASDGEVRVVVMSPSDMLPAMSNGVIAGYSVADPFNAMAEVREVGRIHRFLGDLWRNHACCAVVMREDTIDGDPGLVQRFTNALTTAQLDINADRPAAATALTEGYLPQPEPAIARALTYPTEEYADSGAVLRPDWHGNQIGFAPFPFADYTENLVDAMGRTLVDVDTRFLDDLDPADVHADLVDDTFAREAIEASGSPAAFGLPDSLTRTEEVDIT
ncbi:ABC transporter substrate-binding protein [Spiractinospora alimapuensis]|uniref:ABC transporter substrate-binding protein n=1 Tax=Spiractinospora alimapuensis TaxID=2820884 RepID=UPI001F27AA73|nr:ABC transporter substrate-binding protein [Spiractinospora alimapuensis]QVQ50014.1 ABC transporter substrate-binding protein [Spiractinospora alimapuensis]